MRQPQPVHLAQQEVADIALSFAGAGPSSARDAASAIVDTALRRGSKDNCTAVVGFLARRCATDVSPEVAGAVRPKHPGKQILHVID